MPPLSHLFDEATRHACNDVSSSHSSFTAVASSKSPISPEKSRTVSFVISVQVFDHIHRNEYSAEEKKSCRFVQENYNEMRAERNITVKLMERGQPMVNDGQQYYRGLESKTREGSRRKQFNAVDASMTVLDEQSQQAQLGVRDPEAISKLCIACTAHCVAKAQERGLTDQSAALESLSVAAPCVSQRQPRRLSCQAA